MGFMSSMNVSASALTATRLRMDVIAENIANSNTTRTEDGGPYRRKFVVFQEVLADRENGDSRTPPSRPQNVRDRSHDQSNVQWAGHNNHAHGGVRVVQIGQDMSEFKLDYNPSHPDADEDGFVRLPNVEVVQEMTDMMAAFRAYEANITALNAFKDMAMKTLEIGK